LVKITLSEHSAHTAKFGLGAFGSIFVHPSHLKILVTTVIGPNAEPTRKTTCHRSVAHKLQQFVNRTFPKAASLNSHYQFLTNNGFGSTCSPSFTAPRFVLLCETLEATREDIAFHGL
jgi:hypothetical protein